MDRYFIVCNKCLVATEIFEQYKSVKLILYNVLVVFMKDHLDHEPIILEEKKIVNPNVRVTRLTDK